MRRVCVCKISRNTITRLGGVSTLGTGLRRGVRAILLFMLCALISGCLTTQRIGEISRDPYPVMFQNESTTRFGDPEDDVLMEVRRAKTSRPINDLAIQYSVLFPGGEVIKPGDKEEYVKIRGKNAYKVTFKTKYIRKRKRIGTEDNSKSQDVAPGWKTVMIRDSETGKSVPVMYGPVIPRERTLYLVAGDSEVYAIFMRADGDAIEPAKKKFDKLVREEITYK